MPVKRLTTYTLNSKFIKHWLIDHDMTRRQLAAEAGISESTLKRATNCNHNCNIDTLLNLARIMGVDPWDLVREVETLRGGDGR